MCGRAPGFRKTEFKGGAGTGGVYLNDRFVYLKGYAQRSTDEWAGLGARTNSIPTTNPPTRLPSSTNLAANTNLPEFAYRNFVTNTAVRADWSKRRFGGRYDVNESMDLYPQMSKDYGNDKLIQAKKRR